MSQVPFPSRTAQLSGAGTLTVFSGPGVLLGVIATQISGGTTTYSGSVLKVVDAISGMTALQSGILLYSLDFATNSGLANGQNAIAAQAASQNIPYCEYFINSGLVALGAAGWVVNISYSK